MSNNLNDKIEDSKIEIKKESILFENCKSVSDLDI